MSVTPGEPHPARKQPVEPELTVASLDYRMKLIWQRVVWMRRPPVVRLACGDSLEIGQVPTATSR
jgi:hypothetical protein